MLGCALKMLNFFVDGGCDEDVLLANCVVWGGLAGFCDVCVLVFLLVSLVCMVAILFSTVVGVFACLRDDVIY